MSVVDPNLSADATGGDGFGLLEDFSEDDWGLFFTFLEKHEYDAGEVLLRQGDRGQALFILTGGTLEVRVETGDRSHTVDVVEEGTVFGEQSFADGGPRTATIVAVSDGEYYRLGQADFARLSEEFPEIALAFMRDIARVLSLRCRRLQRVRKRLLSAQA